MISDRVFVSECGCAKGCHGAATEAVQTFIKSNHFHLHDLDRVERCGLGPAVLIRPEPPSPKQPQIINSLVSDSKGSSLPHHL